MVAWSGCIGLISCKKIKENILTAEQGERMYQASNDVQSMVFLNNMLNQIAQNDFYQVEDYFTLQSDTVAGMVATVVGFENAVNDTYYLHSTTGNCAIQFALPYGSDTVSIQLQDFSSNDHLYSGSIRYWMTYNAGFNDYVVHMESNQLTVEHGTEAYTLSFNLEEHVVGNNGSVSGSFFHDGEQDYAITITQPLELSADFSITAATHLPYFQNGSLAFPALEESVTLSYGTSPTNLSQAVVLVNSGYRYIIKLSRM